MFFLAVVASTIQFPPTFKECHQSDITQLSQHWLELTFLHGTSLLGVSLHYARLSHRRIKFLKESLTGKFQEENLDLFLILSLRLTHLTILSCDPTFYLVPFSQHSELCYLMVMRAETAPDPHIRSQFFYVCKYEVQQLPSVHMCPSWK